MQEKDILNIRRIVIYWATTLSIVILSSFFEVHIPFLGLELLDLEFSCVLLYYLAISKPKEIFFIFFAIIVKNFSHIVIPHHALHLPIWSLFEIVLEMISVSFYLAYWQVTKMVIKEERVAKNSFTWLITSLPPIFTNAGVGSFLFTLFFRLIAGNLGLYNNSSLSLLFFIVFIGLSVKNLIIFSLLFAAKKHIVLPDLN